MLVFGAGVAMAVKVVMRGVMLVFQGVGKKVQTFQEEVLKRGRQVKEQNAGGR